MIPEQPVTVAVGADVSLEARLARPDSPSAGVVICHPHPLYGGDMDNPVVVRAQEVCAGLGFATLRFNFRGVGASGGTHGGGVGEQEDARAALDVLAKSVGEVPLALAGYSFGARIAALVGSRDPRIAGLALIAPPLAMYDFGCLEGTRVPTLMVAGTVDQYCPQAELARLAERFTWTTAVSIEGADHFFFGKLFPLGQAIEGWARRLPPDRAARSSR
jgi:alpha/beta superfamily hydrolase